MPFDQFIRLIQTGEPVAPGTDNRPLGQLDRNTRYLHDLIRAAAAGTTLYARGVTVEAAAAVGMALYWNPAAQRFARGLAGLTADAGGALAPAAASQVWGVVFRKQNATLADLVVAGYVDLDISGATGGDTAAGLYYLSPVTPGFLTRTRPGVAVPVLRSDGQGRVLLVPTWTDLLDRHRHLRFELTCRPAGTTSPPAGEGRHVVVGDDALPGWLPADHPAFGGLAPAGASFGYNIAQDPALAAAWPPGDPAAVYLEWSKGASRSVGFTGVPDGPQGLAVVDGNGVWWMSDCYDDVPWPADTDTSVTDSVSESLDECQRNLFMRMRLWMTRPNFVTDGAVVTSLRSNDARLTVRCPDGTPGASGPLVLDLDFSFEPLTDSARGALVVKDVADGEVTRGPVTEGVYAVGDNVTLTSDRATVKRVPGDGDSEDVHQGLVGIAVSTQQTLEAAVQLVRLDGVTEEFFQDVMYLGFPPDEATSYRGKIYVPADLSLPSPTLRLRFRVLGRAAGVLPALTLTARRVPRPADGLDAPEALPLSDSAVTITTTATLGDAGEYVEADADPFEVAAGDVVLFTLARGEDDAYPAEVGVLQHVGLLEAGA